MNKFIKVCFSFLFLLLGSMAFADDWYLCLGSYKDLDNAKVQANTLNNNDIPVLIYEHKTSSSPDVLYRILMDEPYSTEAKAVTRRNQVQNFKIIQQLKITNIWCFQPWPRGIQKAKEAKRTGVYSVPAPVTTPKEITMNIQPLEERQAELAAQESEEIPEAPSVEVQNETEIPAEGDSSEVPVFYSIEDLKDEEFSTWDELSEILQDKEGVTVSEIPDGLGAVIRLDEDNGLLLELQNLGVEETDAQFLEELSKIFQTEDATLKVIRIGDEVPGEDEYAKILNALINKMAEDAVGTEGITPPVYEDDDPDRPSMIPYNEDINQLIINYTPYLNGVSAEEVPEDTPYTDEAK